MNLNTFTHLLKSTLPAYFFPALMAGTSGILLNDSTLVHASYSAIAIPSFIAAIISCLLIHLYEKKTILKKAKRVVLNIAVIMCLNLILLNSLPLQKYQYDILISSFIGALITSLSYKVKEN